MTTLYMGSKEFELNGLMDDQYKSMDSGEQGELNRCMRDIRFFLEGSPTTKEIHRLDGREPQGILQGAHAIDYGSGDNRGRWRLIFDTHHNGDGNKILLHAIVDYHANQSRAPLYGGRGSVDLTD